MIPPLTQARFSALKRELTDAEFWKLGDYVMKNLKAGRTFTDAELLKAVKDCAADSSSWQDDDASDVKFAKEQLAVFQGISNSVVRFRMTTPNGTKFAKAYRLAKEILDSVYEIETELKHFV